MFLHKKSSIKIELIVKTKCRKFGNVKRLLTSDSDAVCDKLLYQYVDITKPTRIVNPRSHNTVHFIDTTPKTPVTLDKWHQVATRWLKTIFLLVKEGIVWPSRSNRASRLLIPKTNGDWKPCGYYRTLNYGACTRQISCTTYGRFRSKPGKQKDFSHRVC